MRGAALGGRACCLSLSLSVFPSLSAWFRGVAILPSLDRGENTRDARHRLHARSRSIAVLLVARGGEKKKKKITATSLGEREQARQSLELFSEQRFARLAKINVPRWIPINSCCELTERNALQFSAAVTPTALRFSIVPSILPSFLPSLFERTPRRQQLNIFEMRNCSRTRLKERERTFETFWDVRIRNRGLGRWRRRL
mgnify:CR=1 FL=1